MHVARLKNDARGYDPARLNVLHTESHAGARITETAYASANTDKTCQRR